FAVAHDAIPPHDAGGNCHECRYQSDDHPDDFQAGMFAPSAEMKTAEPKKNDVARPVACGDRTPQELDRSNKRFRNPEVNARNCPHQCKEKQPEPHGAM